MPVICGGLDQASFPNTNILIKRQRVWRCKHWAWLPAAALGSANYVCFSETHTDTAVGSPSCVFLPVRDSEDPACRVTQLSEILLWRISSWLSRGALVVILVTDLVTVVEYLAESL